MKTLVNENIQTLMFLRTRFEVELYAKIIKQELTDHSKILGESIMSYRGGISPQDRRAIEDGIKNRNLLGVTTTNALEVGIDIGDLDSVVIGGFPGSVNSFWQQAGRAGRTSFEISPDQQSDAYLFYIPKINPLDMYYCTHHQELMDSGHEDGVIDLSNVLIAKNHLWCSVHERPLLPADLKYFGTNAQEALNMLEKENKIKKFGMKYLPVDINEFPPKSVALDNIDSDKYTLLVEENGRNTLLTTEDKERIFLEIYPKTVYIYMTETYLVKDVNHTKKIVSLEKKDLPYYTKVRIDEDIHINAELDNKSIHNFNFFFGEVTVFFTPLTIEKRNIENDDLLSNIEIEESYKITRELNTKAVWWTFPMDYACLPLYSEKIITKLNELLKEDSSKLELRKIAKDCEVKLPEIEKGLTSYQFQGGIHAMEHACIAMIPYFQLCDRNDIGGVSSPRHADTELPTVFIYDGYQGGIGITQRVFQNVKALFYKTEKMIEACKCKSGCPACVFSPKCGNNNDPIDKHSALLLLKLLKFKLN
jgi:DEAD/DEAH box helicase domain-containing protein